MQIEVKNLPKSEVKLTIELSAEETQKYMEKAASQVSEVVKVPGFRPGHVPLDVLKGHVREGVIENHMIELAVPDTYSDALAKEKVKAISRPKVNILGTDPLKYEAVVATYPQVSVDGYEKIKIDKKEVKVEDKDVDEVLAEIQKKHATFKEVDRAAKKGDRVEVDFEGFDEGGAVLESTKSKNHPVILGEGTLVPGFEEELEGVKKGEEKEFTVTFPKDYFHKPFQGKKVKFKAKMNTVAEVELPGLTPDFLKKIAGAEIGLDEVKLNIRANLEHERKHEEHDRRENEYLEEVIKHTKVELPDSLVDEEVEGMIQEFSDELEGRGLNLQKYLEATKKEIKDLKEERKKEAQKRLSLRFGLQHLFEQEKIQVSDADIKKELEKIKNLYPENERYKIDQEYKEGSYLVKRLENKLKIDKLFEKYLQ
ncbi:MAG TPA: trigger factor [Candidatus Gracilibacteria bacterium]|nr:trigger factor [Candidatus Gracilibacteria bacterium]